MQQRGQVVLQKVSQAQYIVDDGIIKLPYDLTTKLFATDPYLVPS
jgi:hypothetical protein